jgi:hypothetical protein
MEMRMTRVQSWLFLIAALLLGYCNWMSMMWAVWGAPLSWNHYVGLLAELCLLVAAIISFKSPERGRGLALLAILGMSTFWLPAVSSLVPTDSVRVSPASYLIIGLYVATFTFALCFPSRSRLSIAVCGALWIVVGAICGITYVRRAADGEYDRPTFVFCKWHGGGTELTVSDPLGAIDSPDRDFLGRSGLRGRIDCDGATGDPAK